MWTTNDSLDDTVATASDYKWGTTITVQKFNDFTASTRNTAKKSLEMHGGLVATSTGVDGIPSSAISAIENDIATSATVTLTISSQTIVAPVGTPVEQNGAIGTLKTELTGATTSIVIANPSGTFNTNDVLKIGGWIYKKGLTPVSSKIEKLKN